jgi:hypothetical protein
LATDLNFYIDTKPGLEQAGPASTRLRVTPSEGAFGHLAFNDLSSMVEKRTLMSIGGRGDGYNTTRYTATLDNSSTAAYVASGLRLQTQATPSDNDDQVIASNEAHTVAQDKVWKAVARVQVSSAANMGLVFGVVTAGSTEIYTAAPADGVYLIKAKNAATLVGRVIENGQAADDSGTLLTMADATDAIIGFEFCAGSTAALSWGSWYINGTRTAFTADQVTAVRTMLATTPASLQAMVGTRVNSTTQRNAVLQYALVEVDR